MALVEYNVSDVEPQEDQDFDTPIPKGLYKCRVDEAEYKKAKSSDNMMIALTLEVAGGDFKGRLLWDYIVQNEASAWKMRQLVDAFGLKPKGKFNPQKLEGEVVMVRVKHETDEEYGTRSKVAALLPLPEDEPEEAEDEEEAEGDESEEEYSAEDIDEMDRDELEELIEEEELEVKFNSKTKDPVLQERVKEALGIEEDDEDEDEEDDEEEGEDYEDMTLSDLKATAKERGLKTSGSKKALINRLEKDDEEEDGDEPF